MKTTDSARVEQICLAGGCFWGIQHLFKQLHGVRAAKAGYANSEINNPTYEEVKTGHTGAAEAVMVEYNATVVDLAKLLNVFMSVIDPTSLNRQGADMGTQYRTGIYYTTGSQKDTALKVLDEVQRHLGKKTVVEVLPLKNFFPAEDYHQDYLDKTPGGYCHISKADMEAARHAHILKAEAPTQAAHSDADYANEATHAPAHGQPYENGAKYPDTHYPNNKH